VSDGASRSRPGGGRIRPPNPAAEIPADPHPLRPTALEIASGRMYGEHRDAAELPADSGDRARSPLTVLEDVLLPALRRPPCLVSFSGGRDSSAVLAAATRAARREALPPPVPVTLRVRNAPMAEESEWQERVVRHLGLREWEVREVGEELDRLGPLSVAVIRRHGVLYPPNTFLQVPLLEAARGGTLLNGFGGDELFTWWRWRYHADLFARRRRPRPRDALALALATTPAGVRSWWERRRSSWEALPWLRPNAASMASRLYAAERAGQPRYWSRWVGWFMRRRMLAAARWSLSLLASDVGTLLLHPLLDHAFVEAVAKAGRRLGFGDRTAAMRAIFADALPDALLSRRTKARYSEALWGRRAREFAEGWGGGGIDYELVNPELLRNEWLKPLPHDDSAMLMHAAWLSESGHGSRTGPPGHVAATALGLGGTAPERS
jgi:asparagine synthetase B (glutamine-hydrolysing)